MCESIPVVIPRENLNDEFVTLVAWLVKSGARVNEGQAIAQIESSKTVFEIPAPVAGVVEYTLQEGQDVEVGSVLCTIHSNETSEISVPVETHSDAEHTGSLNPSGEALLSVGAESATSKAAEGSWDEVPPQPQTRFSRQALELLQKHGLDPKLFAGRGLVRSSHILEILGEDTSPKLSSNKPVVESGRIGRVFPEPIPALGVPVRREKLLRSKLTEVRYLASSYHNTLASVITVAVPTRGLRAAVEQYTPHAGNTTAIILFEVARLLHKSPQFNAFYADGNIHIYTEINIGFAIDAGHGLKVPVIRNTDTKGIQDIASEMQERLVEYLNDTLPVESLTGGTFTVTDLSGEGVFTFHPLINQGQSAILGIGSEFFPPGSREGLFNLILAFDHQLSEGRQAAKFLQALGTRLQAYEKALGDSTGRENGTETFWCSRCLTPLSKLQDRDHYLIQTVQHNGSTGYICSICLQGW